MTNQNPTPSIVAALSLAPAFMPTGTTARQLVKFDFAKHLHNVNESLLDFANLNFDHMTYDDATPCVWALVSDLKAEYLDTLHNITLSVYTDALKVEVINSNNELLHFDLKDFTCALVYFDNELTKLTQTQKAVEDEMYRLRIAEIDEYLSQYKWDNPDTQHLRAPEIGAFFISK